MLQGSEQVEEVGRHRLGAGVLGGHQGRVPAPGDLEARAPLPVPSVEHQGRIPVSQAQNIDEIIRLSPLRGIRTAAWSGRSTKRRGALKS